MKVPLVDLKAQYLTLGNEIEDAIRQVIDRSDFVSGLDVGQFEKEFAQYLGCAEVVGVASGTAALHLALVACGIKTGDEVITTAHTFAATGEAIVHAGARPVFVDIDEPTYLMDPNQVEDAITSRTRAILPVHLYGQPCDMDALLDCIEIGDVWGIGGRYAKKLLRIGVRTARMLKELPDDWVRENLGGIVGLRLVQELRGMSCIQLEGVRPGKEQIMCSRTFPRSVEKRNELEQAISSFMTRAAEKLRMQDSKVSLIHIFLRTNRHRADEKQYHNWATLSLPLQTAYTPELVHHALFLLGRIYKQGYRYKKAGVMLSGLIPDSETQLNLFRRPIPERCQSMMESVDRINRRWGRHTVRLASSGMRPRWTMRQEMLSPRYTTNWNELKVIRI